MSLLYDVTGLCLDQVKVFLFPLQCRIFLSLMEAADLTDLLKQGGDFTLFAPSDKAFASLSQRDLATLKSKSVDVFQTQQVLCYPKVYKDKCYTLYYASGDINALRTILLYHINNGVFIGGGLEAGVTNLLKSYQGSNIRVVNVSWKIHIFIWRKKNESKNGI